MLPCIDDKIDVNDTDGIRTINLEKGGVHVELKYRQTTLEESETASTYESPREAYKKVEIEILETHLYINDEYVEDELTNDFLLEYYSRIKEFEEYI